MIAAHLTLTACLLLAAANAYPHHQLLYSTGGYQSQQPPSGYYYVPQADAASVTSVQRYAAPEPVALPACGPAVPGSPQYVLFYPGGGPQDNFVYGRADVEPRMADEPEDENKPTIWNLFNVFQRPTTTPKVEAAEDEVTTAKAIVTSTVTTTVEETTPKPSDEASPKPEKFVRNKEEIMLAVEQSVIRTTDERRASLENLDENLPQPPQVGSSPGGDGRQFTLVQRPQFFGNYDFFNQGNMHQRFGLPPGAISNFLLFRNGFAQAAPFPSPVQPGRPLKQVESVVPGSGFPQSVPAQPLEQEAHIVPGSAAIAFQQELNDAQRKEVEANVGSGAVFVDGASTRLALIPGSKHVDVSQVFQQGIQPHFYVAPNPQQVGSPALVSLVPPFQRQVAPPRLVNVGPGYQNVFLLTPTPSQGVVVEADRPRKDDVDQVEAEQAGPSVAQAKPQAIALAGVGGVAAASPVATAVVGPGGLAVSAPTATAVAGPSGGGSLVGPAQAAVAAINKHVTGGKVKTRTRDESYDYTYEEDRHNVQ